MTECLVQPFYGAGESSCSAAAVDVETTGIPFDLPLVVGQSFLDVVFLDLGNWELISPLQIQKPDADALNIEPGAITNITATGFRVQLTGIPEEEGYLLSGSVAPGEGVSETCQPFQLLVAQSTACLERSFDLPLIEGQPYLDVAFIGSNFSDENAWELISPLQVVLPEEGDPLNIEAGIITFRTATGFRVQLTGIPDSEDYRLKGKVTELATGTGEFAFNKKLVSGQSYLDVTFIGTDFVDSDAWTVISPLQTQNLTDSAPLNIKAGIFSSRTSTGFRVQLTGVPNSNNYRLLGKIGPA